MISRRKSVVPPKDQTRLKIEKMEAEREERRRAMLQRKQERAEEEQRNIAAGNPGDVDFIGMVRQWRQEHAKEAKPFDTSHPRICICVRKRPISDKERCNNDHDSITCLNPSVTVHSAKLRVDGITKYIDHNSFQFDYAFDETVSTDDVYAHTAMPVLDFVCAGTGGRATIFAYGQTGSGKTFTMNGIQSILCEDLFLLLSEPEQEDACSLGNTSVMVAFYELYGGSIQDLLNDRRRLKVLEDGKGEINVTGLLEVESHDAQELLEIIQTGNYARTTHTTEKNDTSSRSHAICQIILRDKQTGKLQGKLSLVDLAGSERGSDTKSHNAQRRAESQDINTSLLALKECIRALDMNQKGAKHVPYRASKLTLILKDCFTSDNTMTTMIVTVSPGASATDHSLNTLRYADRIKEKRVPGKVTNKKSPPRRQLSPTRTPPRTPTRSTSPHPPKRTATLSAETKEDMGVDDGLVVKVQMENELRLLVQTLFEQEEEILNLHMSNIQENAELLTEEGKMLQDVQKPTVTPDEIEEYALTLEKILDRKEDMVLALREKLVTFQEQLMKEQQLTKTIGSFSQR